MEWTLEKIERSHNINNGSMFAETWVSDTNKFYIRQDGSWIMDLIGTSHTLSSLTQEQEEFKTSRILELEKMKRLSSLPVTHQIEKGILNSISFVPEPGLPPVSINFESDQIVYRNDPDSLSLFGLTTDHIRYFQTHPTDEFLDLFKDSKYVNWIKKTFYTNETHTPLNPDFEKNFESIKYGVASLFYCEYGHIKDLKLNWDTKMISYSFHDSPYSEEKPYQYVVPFKEFCSDWESSLVEVEIPNNIFESDGSYFMGDQKISKKEYESYYSDDTPLAFNYSWDNIKNIPEIKITLKHLRSKGLIKQIDVLKEKRINSKKDLIVNTPQIKK